MKTAALIPTLNEVNHIKAVVTGAKRYVDEVVVSDGMSDDDTLDVAYRAGASIIWGPRGYGLQVRRGLRYLQDTGFDAVVLLDGDGQHDPNDIPRLVRPIKRSSADIVMGCRGDGMPAYRRFGNKVLTALCNLGSGFKPHDALTGYWAMRLSKLPDLKENGWGMALELLIKSRANGSRMAVKAVKSIYHDRYRDNSAIGPVALGLVLLRAIIVLRIKYEVFK